MVRTSVFKCKNKIYATGKKVAVFQTSYLSKQFKILPKSNFSNQILNITVPNSSKNGIVEIAE
jgi:hypothetical protein